MYLYSLYGYESNIVLTNDKKYTEEEFKTMCKEAPSGDLGLDNPFYSERKIKNYLIEKYNFKEVTYQAGFFFDCDVE